MLDTRLSPIEVAPRGGLSSQGIWEARLVLARCSIVMTMLRCIA
jgi:hypothetical protein